VDAGGSLAVRIADRSLVAVALRCRNDEYWLKKSKKIDSGCRFSGVKMGKKSKIFNWLQPSCFFLLHVRQYLIVAQQVVGFRPAQLMVSYCARITAHQAHDQSPGA
jgi:hypothetical protein